MGTTAHDIDERFAMVESRIAHPLTGDQIAQVKKRIGQSIELGKTLHAYPLANSDAPEIGFEPYRGDDR